MLYYGSVVQWLVHNCFIGTVHFQALFIGGIRSLQRYYYFFFAAGVYNEVRPHKKALWRTKIKTTVMMQRKWEARCLTR